MTRQLALHAASEPARRARLPARAPADAAWAWPALALAYGVHRLHEAREELGWESAEYMNKAEPAAAKVAQAPGLDAPYPNVRLVRRRA